MDTRTDLAVVRTNPKDGYSSVSVVNLSFLGYNENYTPDKLLDRINTLATAYFPLDGVNEKGLAVGVLQLQAPVTAQDNGKPDLGTTVAIRAMLDTCENQIVASNNLWLNLLAKKKLRIKT